MTQLDRIPEAIRETFDGLSKLTATFDTYPFGALLVLAFFVAVRSLPTVLTLLRSSRVVSPTPPSD